MTANFLRSYLNRPEVGPVPESNEAARALHADLLRKPREAVSKERIAAIADPAALENSRVVLGLRDRLLDAATLADDYHGLLLASDDCRVRQLFVEQRDNFTPRDLLEGHDRT